MLRLLHKNNQGVVFVTVVLIILAMMILTVSVVSLNVTQVLRTSGEVKNIQAQYLAQGAIPYLYNGWTYGAGQWRAPSDTRTYTETLDGTVFTVTANLNRPGLVGYNTSGFLVNVVY